MADTDKKELTPRITSKEQILIQLGGDVSSLTLEGPIYNLCLSYRTWNTLRREGVLKVRQLLVHSKEELLGLEGIGKISVEEIERELKSYGWRLRFPGEPLIEEEPPMNIYERLAREFE